MREAVSDSWRGSKAITVQLKAGVTVRGSIEATKNARKNPAQIVAEFLPVRLHPEDFTRENSQRQELGRIQNAVDDRGGFVSITSRPAPMFWRCPALPSPR